MDEHDYSLIIGYLESSITDKDVHYLLHKVQNDSEFAERFNEVAEIWNAGKINHDLPRAKHALKRLHQRIETVEIKTNTKKVINKKLAWLSAAAAILVLCLLFFHTEFNKTTTLSVFPSG